MKNIVEENEFDIKKKKAKHSPNVKGKGMRIVNYVEDWVDAVDNFDIDEVDKLEVLKYTKYLDR